MATLRDISLHAGYGIIQLIAMYNVIEGMMGSSLSAFFYAAAFSLGLRAVFSLVSFRQGDWSERLRCVAGNLENITIFEVITHALHTLCYMFGVCWSGLGVSVVCREPAAVARRALRRYIYGLHGGTHSSWRQCGEIIHFVTFIAIAMCAYAMMPPICILGLYSLVFAEVVLKVAKVNRSDLCQGVKERRLPPFSEIANSVLLHSTGALFLLIAGQFCEFLPFWMQSPEKQRSTTELSSLRNFFVLSLWCAVMLAREGSCDLAKSSSSATTLSVEDDAKTSDRRVHRLVRYVAECLSCVFFFIFCVTTKQSSDQDIKRLLYILTRSWVSETQRSVLFLCAMGLSSFLVGNFVESVSTICRDRLSLNARKNERRTCSDVVVPFVRFVWNDTDSRRIFAFLFINLSFTVVEVVVGILSNSLGLLSDAGHMFFDCSALFISALATYVSSWPADSVFMYGYGRVEILAGFVNAILLIVIALTVLCEALHRIFDPDHHHHEEHLLLPVSVGGFVINIVGLLFFHEHMHVHGECQHGCGDHKTKCSTQECDHHHHHHTQDDARRRKCEERRHHHSHHHHVHDGTKQKPCGHHHVPHAVQKRIRREGRNSNMNGVFLHVLADTLGSVGVIISSFLVTRFGWSLADPICAIIISGLILASAWPLLHSTSSALVLKVDRTHLRSLHEVKDRVLALPGVSSVENDRFWPLTSGGTYVGTLRVRVLASFDEGAREKLRRSVRMIYTKTVSSARVESLGIEIVANVGASGSRSTPPGKKRLVEAPAV